MCVCAFRNLLINFLQDVNDAASVDYYFRKQEVCWTDIGNEFIKCVSLNGTNEKSKLQDVSIKVTYTVLRFIMLFMHLEYYKS